VLQDTIATFGIFSSLGQETPFSLAIVVYLLFSPIPCTQAGHLHVGGGLLYSAIVDTEGLRTRGLHL